MALSLNTPSTAPQYEWPQMMISFTASWLTANSMVAASESHALNGGIRV
jgi:hypothetical protein